MEQKIRRNQTCCIIGIPEARMTPLELQLEAAVLEMANRGVTTFCCGAAPGFDQAAAKTVLRLKEARPALQLLLISGYRRLEQTWTSSERREAQRLRDAADSEKQLYGGQSDVQLYALENSSFCITNLPDTSTPGIRMQMLEKKNALQVLRLSPLLYAQEDTCPHGETAQVFSRVDLQQLREFFMHGVSLTDLERSGKTYEERTRDAQRSLTQFLQEQFEDPTIYEHALDIVMQTLSVFEDVYLELGIQTGAKLMQQLLS